MGQFPNNLISTTFSNDTTGFDAIGVALLGRTTPIGILLGALLFGGLRQGAGLMQLNASVPGDLVFIIIALVIFSIAAEFLPAIQRALPKWMSFGRGTSLVPNITGTSASAAVVDLPENGNGNGTTENGAEPAPEAGESIPEGGG